MIQTGTTDTKNVYSKIPDDSKHLWQKITHHNRTIIWSCIILHHKLGTYVGDMLRWTCGLENHSNKEYNKFCVWWFRFSLFLFCSYAMFIFFSYLFLFYLLFLYIWDGCIWLSQVKIEMRDKNLSNICVFFISVYNNHIFIL